MSRLHTEDFGLIEYEENQVLCLPRGLIGIPGQSWLLLTREPMSPFLWLISIDDPSMSLPVARPEAFFPDYQLTLAEQQLEPLQLGVDSEVEGLCVVGADEDITKFRMNLCGPIIFNPDNQHGVQVVNLSEYPVDAPLWEQVGINQVDTSPPRLPVIEVPPTEES